jgi:hypothetical protein
MTESRGVGARRVGRLDRRSVGSVRARGADQFVRGHTSDRRLRPTRDSVRRAVD